MFAVLGIEQRLNSERIRLEKAGVDVLKTSSLSKTELLLRPSAAFG